jgi:metallo-beta-lactamase superfamily protein
VQDGTQTGEVLDGLWRFATRSPFWTPEEDWPAEVAWWAVRTPDGLVLVDPLLEDEGWPALDAIVEASGGCAAIVRTIWWHQRSIPDAAERYGADVYALPPAADAPEQRPFDRAVADGDTLPGGIRAFEMTRHDEMLLWLPDQHALVFGDVGVRDEHGVFDLCPESWVRNVGGRARLREPLRALPPLEIEHLLVSHGPHVLGDGREALPRALEG